MPLKFTIVEYSHDDFTNPTMEKELEVFDYNNGHLFTDFELPFGQKVRVFVVVKDGDEYVNVNTLRARVTVMETVTDDEWRYQDEWWVNSFSCPNCNKDCLFIGFKFCPKCGVALNWQLKKDYHENID
jgi:hypothetical protein